MGKLPFLVLWVLLFAGKVPSGFVSLNFNLLQKSRFTELPQQALALENYDQIGEFEDFGEETARWNQGNWYPEETGYNTSLAHYESGEH